MSKEAKKYVLDTLYEAAKRYPDLRHGLVRYSQRGPTKQLDSRTMQFKGGGPHKHTLLESKEGVLLPQMSAFKLSDFFADREYPLDDPLIQSPGPYCEQFVPLLARAATASQTIVPCPRGLAGVWGQENCYPFYYGDAADTQAAREFLDIAAYAGRLFPGHQATASPKADQGPQYWAEQLWHFIYSQGAKQAQPALMIQQLSLHIEEYPAYYPAPGLRPGQWVIRLGETYDHVQPVPEGLVQGPLPHITQPWLDLLRQLETRNLQVYLLDENLFRACASVVEGILGERRLLRQILPAARDESNGTPNGPQDSAKVEPPLPEQAEAKDSGASGPKEDGEAGHRSDWHHVQDRLLRLYYAGEPFSSQRDLAERMKCSVATINKAINGSAKLKGWQARHRKKGAPKVQTLDGAAIDNTPDQRENDPAESLPPDDVDRIMACLIERAEPAERAKLNAMDPESRKKMAKVYQEQQADQHIQDDAKTNRMLGRKP